jgi:GH25 family lysozyme M1 (1,4-beta-N-acetylmuramidase)
VVEKIKREYMVYINTDSVGKGKNKAVGIWQYTESGTLEGGNEELGLDSILEGRTK